MGEQVRTYGPDRRAVQWSVVLSVRAAVGRERWGEVLIQVGGEAVFQGREAWGRTRSFQEDGRPGGEAANKVGHVISSDQLVAAPRDGCNRRRGFYMGNRNGRVLGMLGILGILCIARLSKHAHAGSVIEFVPDIPRWRQVAEVVRRRIADGTYPPRTRVPSVVQLTSEFGIANATAHKVLRALREEGLTYTEPGLGSFVAEKAEKAGVEEVT
ncbi:GntR family transcriptional regulator [Streptomyces caelestis]|uniref:GntR family transcriptional regulator n=1 Tax=Streptomyces caelestis TaxID=36816 RepID=UPI0036F4D454